MRRVSQSCYSLKLFNYYALTICIIGRHPFLCENYSFMSWIKPQHPFSWMNKCYLLYVLLTENLIFHEFLLNNNAWMEILWQAIGIAITALISGSDNMSVNYFMIGTLKDNKNSSAKVFLEIVNQIKTKSLWEIIKCKISVQ